MKLDSLKKWEAELVREEARVGGQLEPLLRRRDEIRSKLELVRRLIAIEAEELRPHDGKVVAAPSPGVAVQEAVRNVLEERGGPMHISEIRAALTSRGVPIPGKGTDANIIVHLRRAPQLFVKRGRGTYALKNDMQRSPNA